MNASRLLPFDVRPHPRETPDSYAHRVFAANFSDGHQHQLLRELRKERPDATLTDVLRRHTKRDHLELESHPTGWLSHADGSNCAHCVNQLPARTACTLCTHGAIVEQHPHFDELVCMHHRRWIGLTGAEDQEPVSASVIAAHRIFTKLRRSHRIDVRRYLYVSALLQEDRWHPGTTEAGVFIETIETIRTLSTAEFSRRFFDPAVPFATTYRYLGSVVAEILGHPSRSVTRGLWLWLRPAVAALRQHIRTGTAYAPSQAHDFTIHRTLASEFANFSGDLDNFESYLEYSGDDIISTAFFATRFGGNRVLTPDEAAEHATRPVLHVCEQGHQFEYSAPSKAMAAGQSLTRYKPICGVCTDRRVSVGINDLASQFPEIAIQFDTTRNGGLTAADVAASSKTLYQWVCPEGHPHETSPSKKTAAGYGCPVCSNRVIIPGVNCLVATYPEVAAEWVAPIKGDHTPETIAPGSPRNILWQCPNEHRYAAPVYKRTTEEQGCPTCTRDDLRASRHNIATTHPKVAAEWHPTRNFFYTPQDFCFGEKHKAWWICPEGHEFQQRVDQRCRGYNCSVCSNRKLVAGVNDIGTTEPILIREFDDRNEKRPHELFASNHKLWWKCEREGHLHQQTVQHRRETGGCPLCTPAFRIVRGVQRAA